MPVLEALAIKSRGKLIAHRFSGRHLYSQAVDLLSKRIFSTTVENFVIAEKILAQHPDLSL